jgi:uridylate kinase
MSSHADSATVVSLGGSVITDESGVDEDFLRAFREVITNRIPDRTFYIIAGGGSIARQYQEGLKAVTQPRRESLDWMGIYATRFNAQLLRLMFGDVAHEELVLTPAVAKQASSSVVVGAAGATPGRSSDYAPLEIAKTVGAEHVVQISDISHVYSADPDNNPEANKFDELTWDKYQSLITDQWEPGLNVPIDPVSADYAQQHGIEVAIMSGESRENFTNYLDGNEFTGTTIYSA